MLQLAMHRHAVSEGEKACTTASVSQLSIVSCFCPAAICCARGTACMGIAADWHGSACCQLSSHTKGAALGTVHAGILSVRGSFGGPSVSLYLHSRVAVHHMKKPGRALALSSAPDSVPTLMASSSVYDAMRLVSRTSLPSTVATRPRKCSLPSAPLCA